MKDKIVELLNGDHKDLQTGLEMLKHLTLGEIFVVMKMLQKPGEAATVFLDDGYDMDGRNWFIFRLFNIPRHLRSGKQALNWKTWDIGTIRWINQNKDLKPDRKKDFIMRTGDSGYSSSMIDLMIIRKKKEKWSIRKR
jgi:hypothetical protein